MGFKSFGYEDKGQISGEEVEEIAKLAAKLVSLIPTQGDVPPGRGLAALIVCAATTAMTFGMSRETFEKACGEMHSIMAEKSETIGKMAAGPLN